MFRPAFDVVDVQLKVCTFNPDRPAVGPAVTAPASLIDITSVPPFSWNLMPLPSMALMRGVITEVDAETLLSFSKTPSIVTPQAALLLTALR